MGMILVFLVVFGVFGLCYLVDKSFTKLFRSQAQHKSGLAVRPGKQYPLFGLGLCVLGVMALCTGGTVLVVGGLLVLITGLALTVYYLSFGIFYDESSFLVSRFGKQPHVYRYEEILGQRLYLIQGGSILVELHLSDGKTVGVNSNMSGAYPFLDAAFTGWCRQTGQEPESCEFHDPANSLWFPTVEEV